MKQILKLIESVDPKDNATLDEIDARVYCYCGASLSPLSFKSISDGRYRVKYLESSYKSSMDGQWISHGEEDLCDLPNYTRSRDSLKEIRPEGLAFSVVGRIDGSACYRLVSLVTAESDPRLVRGFDSPYLPTEELAELWAILSAIQHERDNT